MLINNFAGFFFQKRLKLLSSSVLKECKYLIKSKKIPKYIIDDTEISSNSDRENSDEEISDGEKSDRENSNRDNSG